MKRENLPDRRPSIAIVLPTLNEEGNIYNLCVDLAGLLGSSFRVEVVVVDDCSTDGTLLEVKRAQDFGLPVSVIRNERRIGLGASIGTGIELSESELIAVMDADFTHSASDLLEMAGLSLKHDFVCGSRFGDSIPLDGLPSYVASRLYQELLRPVLQLPFRDILGGFWITNRKVLASVPMDEVFNGYGDYFFRLLSTLHHKSFSIFEFSATYQDREFGESKSKPINMMFTYFARALLWRMRWKKLDAKFFVV